jgi:8-oxo-dGTP pyrophosphatase MutT (NUDIX family)
MKRNPAQYTGQKVRWDIPGGRIELGSTLLQNLKREIKEETGIVEVSRESLLGAQDIFWTDKHTVRLTYISRVTVDNVCLSPEHTAYKWVKLVDLLKIKDLDKYLKQLLKDKAIMSFIKDYVKKAR